MNLKYERNNVICRQGETARNTYFVLSGVLASCHLRSHGKRFISKFHFTGDIIEFGFDPNYSTTVVALTSVRLARHRKEEIFGASQLSSTLSKHLLKSICAENEFHNQHKLWIGPLTAREAVIQFILYLRMTPLFDGSRIQLPMNRYDIADHLALTFETVSRQINALKREGLIHFADSKSLKILKLEELQSETQLLKSA